MTGMQLVRPGTQHLAGYTVALERGWSADTVRGAAAAQDELDRIAKDPATFLALMDDPEGLGPPVTLPDGSTVQPIPSLRRWMWLNGAANGSFDAGFAGTIGLCWTNDGSPLPPHVLGHIGYAVVPWYRPARLKPNVTAAVPGGLESGALNSTGNLLMTDALQDLSFSLHDDAVPADLAAVVDQGLGDANDEAAPLHEVRALACFARNEADTVVGGAIGRTWGRACELQQLWVAPERRRAGLGAQLVRRFEAQAAARGCSTFFLETFSFQAPSFYRSLGYDTLARNAAFPHGIVKYAMARQIAGPPASRSQGTPVALRRVDAAEPALATALGELLADAVDAGASVGFMHGLLADEAHGWAVSTLAALGPGLALWVAEAEGAVVGSVQLAPCLKPNGRHRGELTKLLVHRRARGQGVASALLAAVEEFGRANGLELLVLDTEAGSPAEAIYRHLCWRYGGSIPGYALTPDGRPHATIFMYKLLT